MTQNQIAYLKVREDARANKAKEAENYRHDTATERENETHNRNVEGETYRANRAQENLSGLANSIKSFEASTNRQNADTRQRESSIKAQELQLAQQRYRTDLINKGIDQNIEREKTFAGAATNLIGTVAKVVTGFIA